MSSAPPDPSRDADDSLSPPPLLDAPPPLTAAVAVAAAAPASSSAAAVVDMDEDDDDDDDEQQEEEEEEEMQQEEQKQFACTSCGATFATFSRRNTHQADIHQQVMRVGALLGLLALTCSHLHHRLVCYSEHASFVHRRLDVESRQRRVFCVPA